MDEPCRFIKTLNVFVHAPSFGIRHQIGELHVDLDMYL